MNDPRIRQALMSLLDHKLLELNQFNIRYRARNPLCINTALLSLQNMSLQ